jgi:GT2 family glycosyltransferase
MPDDVVPIDLVTILYNCAEDIDRFLDCLLAQTDPAWRLTAIDNASGDGAAELVAARREPRITLLRNGENAGFARAANQGIRHAASGGGTFFVVINNDVAFAADFLARFRAARDTTGAKVISPRILCLNNPAEAWYAGGRIDRSWVLVNVHEFDNPPDLRPAREVGFVSGCCLGLDRAVLERVGLFDESFFVYWEDTDLCLRLEKAGVKMYYVREPVVLHAAGAASGGERSPRYIALYYRSYMQLLRKHFGLRSTPRDMARLLVQAWRWRSPGRLARCGRMAVAMLRGCAAPLRPQARL